jgi:hypothetical protein
VFSLLEYLVEIDLLRTGQRPGAEINTPPLDAEYILLVNRAQQGDERISEIWPIALNEPLGYLPVPLLAPDPDILLDLDDIMQMVYQRGAYNRRIDYHQPIPPPRLRPAMQKWMQERT